MRTMTETGAEAGAFRVLPAWVLPPGWAGWLPVRLFLGGLQGGAGGDRGVVFLPWGSGIWQRGAFSWCVIMGECPHALILALRAVGHPGAASGLMVGLPFGVGATVAVLPRHGPAAAAFMVFLPPRSGLETWPCLAGGGVRTLGRTDLPRYPGCRRSVGCLRHFRWLLPLARRVGAW